MDEFYSKHYITIDNTNRIIDGWSDGPHPDRDTSSAILLNAQGGYQFQLAPDGEENPPLYTMDGIPLYCWDGESVRQRTDDEIETERLSIPAPPPSELEQLRADVDYIAIMGGVEL